MQSATISKKQEHGRTAEEAEITFRVENGSPGILV